jgi:hypothetical protein
LYGCSVPYYLFNIFHSCRCRGRCFLQNNFVLSTRIDLLLSPQANAIVKNRASLLVFTFLSILVIGSVSPAWAAQLNWDAKDFTTAQQPQFIFQRTAFIEYPEGGQIADALRGQQVSVSFTANSTTTDLQALIDELNQSLSERQSSAQVTGAKIEYRATMVGRGDQASVDYRVVLTPTINGFLIREYTEGSPALFDITWRGLKADGPITVSTEQYGVVEVNQPLSFFKSNFPDVASAITGEAENILTMPLIDSSGIGDQPITNWHFLFDPTGVTAQTSQYGFSGAKVVVSSFTMGESSFREGQVREKEFDASFSADTTYHVRTVQSGDAGNIFLAGFASPDKLQGHEVVGVSAVAPTTAAQTSTGSFPVFIIYGMAGMAAAGAGGFFYWSSKKAKRESEYVQTGIDPKYLRAVGTSEASGGYHTVRGEAELATGEGHERHASVYEQQSQALPKEEEKPSSSRGSMPKGWKPS